MADAGKTFVAAWMWRLCLDLQCLGCNDQDMEECYERHTCLPHMCTQIAVQVIKRSSQKTQSRRSSLKVCLVPLRTCCVHHAAETSCRTLRFGPGVPGASGCRPLCWFCVQTFVKVVNYQHIMPTRYTLDVDLKSVVTVDVVDNSTKRKEACKVWLSSACCASCLLQ